MKSLSDLFDRNRAWADRMRLKDPEFFSRLTKIQTPKYLWIGCSDSRVPANEIVDVLPGEMFVHRNVGNLLVHTDMNALSVLQYAVEILHVEHVIVCGHYGCGGVAAALDLERHGLIDHWLMNIWDVYRRHKSELDALRDHDQKLRRLCELNILAQLYNVCESNTVQDAWARGERVHVHGWVYDLADGRLRDLGTTVSGPEEWLRRR